jgi:hypothetical protein
LQLTDYNFSNLKTKFHNLSLQGIPGIIFGIISIIFIWTVQLILTDYSLGAEGIAMLPISFFEIFIAVFSVIYILISYFTITIINKRRRKKVNLKGWDINSKKIRNVFLSYLFAGGILTYFFVSEGYLKLIIPTSLILYGIACFLTNKYTLGASKILGLLLVLNGIAALLFPPLMFYLWGVGFGFYSIIYGLYFFKKV